MQPEGVPTHKPKYYRIFKTNPSNVSATTVIWQHTVQYGNYSTRNDNYRNDYSYIKQAYKIVLSK